MIRLLATAAVAALLGATSAQSAGVLNIYNWGNYTNPDLIKKFETKYDIKVTITEFDSNDTALAKIRQGGHGFDMVVPSAPLVPIWIKEGLLLETRPDQMENFKNVDPRWADVAFDRGRHYTIPWLWGATGVSVNTAAYKGDINTSKIFMDPPAELAGKLNVIPEMNDVLQLAIMYVGGRPCTDDKELLRKVRDQLVAAKAKWQSMDYPDLNKYAAGDVLGGVNWSGASYRARLMNKDVAFGYPQEGFLLWMDNLAVLADAKNVENAKLFQNFMMDPENAAMNSTFVRYANGLVGWEKFVPADFVSAPEITPPAALRDKGVFPPTCPAEVQKIYTQIWTDVMK